MAAFEWKGIAKTITAVGLGGYVLVKIVLWIFSDQKRKNEEADRLVSGLLNDVAHELHYLEGFVKDVGGVRPKMTAFRTLFDLENQIDASLSRTIKEAYRAYVDTTLTTDPNVAREVVEKLEGARTMILGHLALRKRS